MTGDDESGRAALTVNPSAKPQAELQSVLRGWGELPRFAFTVMLASECPSFGEWRQLWQPDETTFSVEVISLGFRSTGFIGSPDTTFRRAFSAGDIESISNAVAEMFKDAAKKKQRFPFTSSKAIFTGEVLFRPDWIKSTLRL